MLLYVVVALQLINLMLLVPTCIQIFLYPTHLYGSMSSMRNEEEDKATMSSRIWPCMTVTNFGDSTGVCGI